MSISVARSLLGAAIALATFGSRSDAPPSVSPPAPRPSVAFRLRIDGENYRRILEDSPCLQKCQRLQRAFADTVRPMLQRTYAFLDWGNTSGPALDTIEIRVLDAPPREGPGSKLDFTIRSAGNTARMAKPSYPLPFESFTELSERATVPERWHPDSMRRTWAARIEPLLRQPDLLMEVFGRIPIGANVVFRDRGRALVAVRAADIGAGDGVRPAFRVRLKVTDPQRGTTDDADLILAGCQPASSGPGYVCDARLLQYVAQQPLGVDSTIAILARAGVQTSGVFVVEYATAGQPSRFNGAVLPGALP